MVTDETANALAQNDFLGELCASDLEGLPPDVDLIFDAYENDDFWLPSDDLEQPPAPPVEACQPTNAERFTIGHHLDHPASSWKYSSTTKISRDDGNMQWKSSPAKARAARSGKQMPAKKKQTKSGKATSSAPPLSAYNFFFRVERVRLLEEVSGNGILGHDSHPSNVLSFYSGVLAVSRREFQDIVLQDHWGRDPNARRKHRKSHGQISFQSLSQKIAQNWRIVPDQVKQVFHEMSARDFERHEMEKRKTVLPH